MSRCGPVRALVTLTAALLHTVMPVFSTFTPAIHSTEEKEKACKLSREAAIWGCLYSLVSSLQEVLLFLWWLLTGVWFLGCTSSKYQGQSRSGCFMVSGVFNDLQDELNPIKVFWILQITFGGKWWCFQFQFYFIIIFFNKKRSVLAGTCDSYKQLSLPIMLCATPDTHQNKSLNSTCWFNWHIFTLSTT